MPWTNWGEQINREEMLGFVKQIRNRCDMILQFKPQDYLLYTLLEDIYEDAQAVATGYSAMTEEETFGGWWICQNCGGTHSNDIHKCPVHYYKDGVFTEPDKWADTDCTGDEQ